MSYLKASWQAEHTSLYADCLNQCLMRLRQAVAKARQHDDEWRTDQVVIGESLRLLGRLAEAEAHFESLAGRPEFEEQPYRTIRSYELELIGKQDKLPRNTPEIVNTEADLRRTPAFRILALHPKLSAYTNVFVVKEVDDETGCTVDVYFFGRSEWKGDFVPREKLACETTAELIFPKTGKLVEVGLSAEEVLAALREASQAPFLRDLQAQRQVGVRLRAAGDRLHWETAEVKPYQKLLRNNGLGSFPLKQWMHIILDLDQGQKPKGPMISLYHPKDSDLYVLSDSDFLDVDKWRNQYEQLTGRKAVRQRLFWEGLSEEHVPVIDRAGNLRVLKKDRAAP
jgi:hypothetical protein